MITKMTKYSFILLSNELDDFLSKVQNLGLVDITRSDVPTDSHSVEMMNLYKRYQDIISRLKIFRKENSSIKAAKDNTTSSKEMVRAAEDNFAKREELRTEIASLERELAESAPWGLFSHEDLERINSLGFRLCFYSTTEKRYDAGWEQEYAIQILNREGGNVYFAVAVPQGEECSLPLNPAKFPDRSADIIERDLKVLKDQRDTLLAECAGYTDRCEWLASQSDVLFKDLDLYLASVSGSREGEGTISVLEGFAPKDDDNVIKEFLDSSDVIYLSEKAKGEDNPPIKLKSNWFAKAFEPIGGLYILPTYDELDLTPFFAPFYMLFFGLCLGDMGYGLILILTGLAAVFALPKFRNYGFLIFWLGVGSTLMPLLSGTFFGLKLAEIIPSMPDSIKGLFFSDIKMFWFSIIFGLFQIVFARILRAIFALSKGRIDEGLTEIGWSLVIVWAAAAYASMEMGSPLIPQTAGYVMGITGLVLVLFCSKPNKNFLLRPLMGIISLYDITGIFGDMLSYIRLFGLGTTGGILAFVINSIAMQFTGIPYVGWVLTVVFLIFGHLAVMGLSCLGAFVHPVRLTFVEFYKNAGFVGGGRAFKPLSNK